MNRPFRFELLSVVMCVLLSACSSSQSQANEKAPALETQSPAPAPERVAPAKTTPAPAAATLSEVKSALTRVYQDNLLLPANAAYVLGDFNGDGSQDLAVVAEPRTQALAQLNDDVANWTIQQARHHNPAAQPKVSKGDHLLAIIHGEGEKGWRNPDAQQGYLLKSAAGLQIRAQHFVPPKPGVEPGPFVQPGSDVIRERLEGDKGFLYWDGARYRWYSE